MRIRFLVGGECPSQGIGKFEMNEERDITPEAEATAPILVTRGIAEEVMVTAAAPKKNTQAPAPDKEA